MSLKLKEEKRNLHVLNTLMEDDSNVNIWFEKSCNEHEGGNMWGSFTIISFLDKKKDEKRASNMWSMMSNPRYKSLRLIFFFIDCEQEMIIKYSIFN